MAVQSPVALRPMKFRISRSRAGLLAGVLDQTATSVAAFLVVVAVARSDSVDHFGVFVLVQTLAVLAMGIARATVGTSLLTVSARTSNGDGNSGDGKPADPLPGALAFASLIWLIGFLALAALAIPDWTGSSLCLAWGVALGPLVLLDVLRCSLHGRGRHFTAAGLAVSQLAVLLVGLTILIGRDAGTPVAVVLAYGCLTLLVFAVGAAALRVHPFSLRRGAAFVARELAVWRGYSANYLIDAAMFTAVPFVVAASGGLAVAAGVRACQTVAGLPLQVPHGLSVFVLGKGSEEIATTGSIPAGWSRIWTLGHMALFGTATAVVLLVDDDLGTMFLGETWTVASPALPFVMIASLFFALTFWPDILHRIHGTSGRMAKVRLVNVPMSLALAAVGARVSGTVGATLGLATASAVLFVVAWRARPQSRVAARRPRGDAVGDHPCHDQRCDPGAEPRGWLRTRSRVLTVRREDEGRLPHRPAQLRSPSPGEPLEEHVTVHDPGRDLRDEQDAGRDLRDVPGEGDGRPVDLVGSTEGGFVRATRGGRRRPGVEGVGARPSGHVTARREPRPGRHVKP